VHSVRPTASYRALDLGASAAEVGLVAASYAVLSAFAAVPLGRAIDRLAPRRFFLAGGVMLGIGAVLSAVAPTILVLAAGQAFVGLGQVSAAIALQTMIATWWHDNRDTGFARVGVAASSGQLVGPLLAGAILELQWAQSSGGRGTTAVFVVGSVLAVISVLLIRTITEVRADRPTEQAAADPDASQTPVRTIVGRNGMPQALIASIAVLTALDLLIAYLPVLGEARGLSPGLVGAFLALRAAAGLLSRLNMSRMLDLVGRRRLLFGSMLAASAAMLGIAGIGSPWAVGLFVTVVGYALGVGSPMTMAWVVSRAPPTSRGTALAVRMTGNRVGQVVVPAAVGGLATLFGPGAVFVAVATTLLASSTRVRTSPLDDQH
jgi:MFS family permease